MSELDQLIEFVKFTNDIRRIERAVNLEDDKHENDAEHSYQMAMVALYIIDKHKLKLDKFKCMALALAHDVIEVYAGDLIVFAPKKDLVAKLQREKEAVQTLKANWPMISSLHELVKEYEDCQTPEAKFVYALDKLMPEINNYMFGGKAWKEHGVSLKQVKEIKKGKIELNPIIHDYHKQILKIFDQHPELFGSKIN